ncbi:MAG: GNAT family N-acetyltransferase [Gammaproteobacteria bacterium]
MQAEIDISIVCFQELSLEELYKILQLRQEVFVVEQNCPYLDADGNDALSFHLIGRIQGEIQAYLRIVPPGIKFYGPSLGRVITAMPVRGEGYGKAILMKALDFVAFNYPNQEVSISAQHRLTEYYQDLGFKEVGEIYLEDDIDHIKMVMLPKVLKSKTFTTRAKGNSVFFAMGGLFLGAMLIITSFIKDIDISALSWVAKIEDKVISRERFEQYLNSIDQARASGLIKNDHEKILERMIDEELLIRRAIDLGYLDNNPQVRSLLIQKMIENILSETDALEITNTELEIFYNSNQDFFLANPKLSMEVLKFSSYDLAHDAKQFLLAGEADLAMELADRKAISLPRGLLPATKTREYVGPTLTSIALNMESGSISDPIQIDEGFHLIILYEKSFDTPKPFQSIVDQVRAEFLKQKRDELLRDYLINLRKWYDVTKSTDL